jgi:hypothetical protein
MVPLIFKEHLGQNRIVLKMIASILHYMESYTIDEHDVTEPELFQEKRNTAARYHRCQFQLSHRASSGYNAKKCTSRLTSSLRIIKLRPLVVDDFCLQVNELSV